MLKSGTTALEAKGGNVYYAYGADWLTALDQSMALIEGTFQTGFPRLLESPGFFVSNRVGILFSSRPKWKAINGTCTLLT